MKPIAIALVLCDNIYYEQSGKTALVGLFSRIYARTFPAEQACMCVYASVTGIRPHAKLRLDIVNQETSHEVASLRGEADGDASPIDVVDVNFVFRGLQFPEPGLYDIRLWGEDDILVARPFQVIQLEKKNKDGHHGNG